MIEVLRSWVTGPLESYAPGFAAELARRGYTANSAAAQVGVVAHLSRWMLGERLDVVGLVEPVIERYMTVRRTAGYTKLPNFAGLGPAAGLSPRSGSGTAAGEPAADAGGGAVGALPPLPDR